MSIFDFRLSEVKVRTWIRDNGFQFPELHDPNVKVDYLETRPNVGLAFSGGGTRAASATIGQLRALNHLGLLNQFRYISCVSGGSWTCVPFTFLSPPHSDETFLGPVIEPENLRLELLDNLDTGSFAYAVSNSVLGDDFLKHAARFAADETFSRAVGEVFLRPFGIDALNRFFTQDQRSLKVIADSNPEVAIEDFYLAKHQRPFLIVGATLLYAPGLDRQAKKYQMEITPIYTGLFNGQGDVGVGGQPIGGGYIETFGFDSQAIAGEVSDAQDRLKVRLGAKRHRFTLSDTIGTSGAAPAEILTEFNLTWLGFPEFRYWPVEMGRKGTAFTVEYEFGDGGNLENLGVIPLLLRKVDSMIVFINTKHPLTDKVNINTSLRNLFGQDNNFLLNHVFRRDQYDPLVQALLAKKNNGEAVVHKATHTMIRNKHYGVEPGDVDVIWVYNELVDDWKDRLPQEISSKLFQGELSNFPHYKTFVQNFPSIIDLSPRQVSLLANLSCWVVRSSEGLIQTIL